MLEYKGVVYKVEEREKYKSETCYSSLSIYFEEIDEWIFECSLSKDARAEEIIDRLLRDGFLKIKV